MGSWRPKATSESPLPANVSLLENGVFADVIRRRVWIQGGPRVQGLGSLPEKGGGLGHGERSRQTPGCGAHATERQGRTRRPGPPESPAQAPGVDLCGLEPPVHRASHGSPGTNPARSSLTRQRPPSPSTLLALSPGRVGPGVQRPRTDAPFLSWGTAWLRHSVERLRASVRGQKARGPRGCPPPSPPSRPLLCSLVVQLAGCCPSAGAVENRGPPTPGSQACQHTPGPRARSPT